MTKKIQILAIIAIVQVMLTVMIWFENGSIEGSTQQIHLLTFKPDEIDHIIIKSREQSVDLTKKDNQWQLLDGFPANQSQVDSLLRKLAGLKYGLPVATSANALERFKLSDNNFERQILLKKGNESVAHLFLGSGAGARLSHARNADQNSVFSVAMGSYDAPDDLDNWQDKSILQFEQDSVTAIELKDLLISLTTNKETEGIIDPKAEQKAEKETVWVMAKLADNEQLDQDKINNSLLELSQLRFNKVIATEKKAEFNLENPELRFVLSFKEHPKRSYLLSKIKDSEDYVLKVSDRDEYFQLASYTAKSILEKVNEKAWLVKPAEIAQSNLDYPTDKKASDGETVSNQSK